MSHPRSEDCARGSYSIALRAATPEDFPTVASIANSAFMEDELIDYICPHRYKYPESLRQHWMRSLKQRYYSPDQHVFIAEAYLSDEPSQKRIVGCGAWRRYGTSDLARSWRKDCNFFQLERQLLYLEEQYIKHFRLDRSLDPKRLAESYVADEKHDPFDEKHESWHLSFAVVDPEMQGRGIGGMLVDWGLKNARKEGVPATVLASQVGRLLYRKKGFEHVGMNKVAEGVEGEYLIWREKGNELGANTP